MQESEIAWPRLMTRYVATDNSSAMQDLIMSLRGSPPQGGISREEAEAVYSLIEAYMGPGRAPDATYARVERAIGDRRDARLALEAFRARDRIASFPEDFSEEDVLAGLEVAEQLDDPGVHAHFLLLRAQLKHQAGNISEAKELNLEALDTLLRLATDDAAYVDPAGNAAINSTSLCALDGDFERARKTYALAREFGVAHKLGQFAAVLEERPTFGADLVAVAERASDYLEGNDPLRALEWYLEAERQAVERGEEKMLCGLLGDLAVAYRRIGNTGAAVATYERAIDVSRKHGDDLSLARWSGNLGGILVQRDDPDGADRCFSEAARAASRSGVSEQVSVAAGNLAALLSGQGRYAEAIDRIDAAADEAGDDPQLLDLWRDHKLGIYSGWGEQLLRETQLDSARDAFAEAIQLVDWDNRNEQQTGAIIYTRIATIAEAQNDLTSARQALDKAISCFQELGQHDQVEGLRAVRAEWD